MLAFCVSYKFVRQKLDGKQFGNGIVFTEKQRYVSFFFSWKNAA
jgi:hypothetical protein